MISVSISSLYGLSTTSFLNLGVKSIWFLEGKDPVHLLYDKLYSMIACWTGGSFPLSTPNAPATTVIKAARSIDTGVRTLCLYHLLTNYVPSRHSVSLGLTSYVKWGGLVSTNLKFCDSSNLVFHGLQNDFKPSISFDMVFTSLKIPYTVPLWNVFLF